MKKVFIVVAVVAVILTVLYKVNNYIVCEGLMEHILKATAQFPVRQYKSEIEGFKELSGDYFAYEMQILGYAEICRQLGVLDYADYSERYFSVNRKVREKAMANLAEFGETRDDLLNIPTVEQIRADFEDNLKKTGMDRVTFCKINIYKNIRICPQFCDFSFNFPFFTEIIMKDFNTIK
jgi:hypothetical protein